ncbi:hypothetical protein NMY22_g18060 [Coprinellus aureogranulatus]|nr:hypothetical protein NMY22_g18060 [Coprinellus aureogranulatus]
MFSTCPTLVSNLNQDDHTVSESPARGLADISHLVEAAVRADHLALPVIAQASREGRDFVRNEVGPLVISQVKDFLATQRDVNHIFDDAQNFSSVLMGGVVNSIASNLKGDPIPVQEKCPLCRRRTDNIVVAVPSPYALEPYRQAFSPYVGDWTGNNLLCGNVTERTNIIIGTCVGGPNDEVRTITLACGIAGIEQATTIEPFGDEIVLLTASRLHVFTAPSPGLSFDSAWERVSYPWTNTYTDNSPLFQQILVCSSVSRKRSGNARKPCALQEVGNTGKNEERQQAGVAGREEFRFAVELLTSLIQHPDGVHAPAPPPTSELAPTTSYAEQGGSVLGEVPHQIRGFLAQFRNLKLVGHGYDRCTGCSESVLEAYEKEGFDMLLKVFNDQKYLETLAGLDKLAEEGEAALEAVEWDEDGEGGDDF